MTPVTVNLINIIDLASSIELNGGQKILVNDNNAIKTGPSERVVKVLILATSVTSWIGVRALFDWEHTLYVLTLYHNITVENNITNLNLN